MKRILLLVLLAFAGLNLSAQSVILKIGTDGYVTIDNANYTRGYLCSRYIYSGTDSTLGILVCANGVPKWLYYSEPESVYKDGDNSNVAFASMAALRTWMNANFEYVDTSSGGSGTVTSVSVNSLTPLFTASVATSTTTPAISYTLSNAAAYTVLTNSTNATASPAYAKVDPLALKNNGGTASSSTYYRGDGQWATPAGGSVDSSMLIFYTQISLTSAQLLSLNTTPVQLVAAPGAGKIIVPVQVVFDYTYGTATYVAGTFQIYEDVSSPIYATIGNVLNATSSAIFYRNPSATNTGGGTGKCVDNAPLMAWTTSSDPTTGDGTLKINVYYKIMTR